MDYVDLYQIHRRDPDPPIEETMEALEDSAARKGPASAGPFCQRASRTCSRLPSGSTNCATYPHGNSSTSEMNSTPRAFISSTVFRQSSVEIVTDAGGRP